MKIMVESLPQRKDGMSKKNYLEPTETSMFKWLFQLNDSKSFHRKWLSNLTSIFNWLFRVPGTYYYHNDGLKPEPSGTIPTQKRCILQMPSSRQSKKEHAYSFGFLNPYMEKKKTRKNLPGFKNTNLTNLIAKNNHHMFHFQKKNSAFRG